ncbi:ATP-binding protein [Kitasatospora sp. NPDC048538]|uniref:GAF domain-containing sensor histidine kinase n=1 Tax=unclassified Kitasatospora TaxID=2633591 RepID=UPI0033D67774
MTSPRSGRAPSRRSSGPSPARRQLAAAATVTSVCLVVSMLWTCYVLVHLGDPAITYPRNELGTLIYALPTAGAGMLLHAHRPGSPLGWVMLCYALALILPNAASAPVWVEVSDPGIVGATVALRAVCDVVSATLFYVLPLWLPSGRLTSRHWWWYIGAVALWQLPANLWFLHRTNAFGHPNPLADTAPATFFGHLSNRLLDLYQPVNYLLIGFAALVLLVRLVRPARPPAADPRKDWALRHRAHVAGLLAAYLLLAGMQDFYTHNYQEHYWLSYTVFAVAGAVWAVAIGYLVIRDGGWRLDRAARSVLTGLLLATGLLTLFVVLAAVLSSWLVPGRGGAALLLIGLVFALGAGLPRATRRAVSLIDHLYYGERAHPYQVLRTLAGRVRQVGEPERLPDALCAAVAEQLRLPGVALTVATRAGQRRLAAVGRLDGRRQAFPLVHRGAPIGELTVGLREGEQELDASDIDILRSLSDQASPAVASLQLLEDLQASREQIVAAREEERRWLRRDIHDGLGPALAGLRLRVDNAAAGGGGEDRLGGTLHGISDGLAMAIREVRRITDRLGPAPLGEFGLARAIRQLAAGFDTAELTVTADLRPDPLPELPAALEVATYRIVAEALNNVLRHARARTAEVTVRVDDAALTLTVRDDGVGVGTETGAGGGDGGGAAGRDGLEQRSPQGPYGDGPGGVGLRSMADRAAEIGGHCTVESLPGTPGTRVVAVLPRSAAAGAPGAAGAAGTAGAAGATGATDAPGGTGAG